MSPRDADSKEEAYLELTDKVGKWHVRIISNTALGKATKPDLSWAPPGFFAPYFMVASASTSLPLPA